MAGEAAAYDPFASGPFPVEVRAVHAQDNARGRVFPCEIWNPREPGSEAAYPLVVYSHPSGYHRRAATFLCSHLASHGYVVAALDHSEIVAPELAPKAEETKQQKAARAEAWIANRVPDIVFLLDFLLNSGMPPHAGRIGIVGHSFGGWTALATPEVDRRIRAVVAMAPASSSQPKPGILRVHLTFQWDRSIPVLYLAGENDTMTPLDGMYELFARTPLPKRMVVLRRADHTHFMDNVEEEHERVRRMPFTGDLAWIPKEMRPASDLVPGDQAHLFTRGLALAHLDAALRGREDATQFLGPRLDEHLRDHGLDAFVYAGA